MEINEIVKIILNMRGIKTEEEIEEFLSSKPRLTHDPELMPDIVAGASLILSEIENGGKICIYGDYDADGITSTTLLLDVLSNLIPDDRLSYYIPSRFDEGYGLNKEAIDYIHKNGTTLIVTVDCGSVSIEEIEYIKSLGIKVIVTDHHTIMDRQADCILINPKRLDSNYPFKELSGCGVAFKLAQVIQKMTNLPKSVLSDVLDLVAIGTIGDIMPLVDENRTIVKYGLSVINQTKRPGLKKLICGASLEEGTLNAENVGYILVPHLNASGRIKEASIAVSLLHEKNDTDKLDSIVNNLLESNIERKRIQNETYERALEIMDHKTEPFNVVKVDNAHEGIIGIVAGKIKEEFYRPTIILTPLSSDNNIYKGTGRSIDSVNIYDILNKHSDLFLKFGGHKGACGFTIVKENIDDLKKALSEDMEEMLNNDPSIFEEKINWDLDLDISDISIELAEQLKLLAPFGTKNSKPLFRLPEVKIKAIRYMGQDNKHARFIATSEFEEELKPIQCVLFNKAKDYSRFLNEEQIVDLIGSIDIQVWQGQKRLQFLVSEING